MPETNNPRTALYFLIGIAAFALFILIVIGFVSFFARFSRELKILNMEIGRTEGAERRRWICKRKRLWLSLIPFVKY